jgi:Zn-dependent protease with chaperone function
MGKYHVERVPFTNRAHRVCSPQAARADSELFFAAFKKEHASLFLPADHQKTVRVNRILSKIIATINLTLANKKTHDWSAAGLDWEAFVLQDDRVWAGCLVGCGKIAVCTGLLDRFGTDEEITVVLAHKVPTT